MKKLVAFLLTGVMMVSVPVYAKGADDTKSESTVLEGKTVGFSQTVCQHGEQQRQTVFRNV